MVLPAGAEAIRSQRNATHSGLELGWEEEFGEPLEDRGFGKFVAIDSLRRTANGKPDYPFVTRYAEEQAKLNSA